MSSSNPSSSSRGKAVQVRGLPDRQHRSFKRACELRGVSQSAALQDLIDDFIASVKSEAGTLYKVLTQNEKRVRRAVENGANVLPDIVKESRLPYRTVREVVEGLVARGELVERTLPGSGAGRQAVGYFLPKS